MTYNTPTRVFLILAGMYFLSLIKDVINHFISAGSDLTGHFGMLILLAVPTYISFHEAMKE
jgi:hypothetical protein